MQGRRIELIHIPKTAGTSLRVALNEHAGANLNTWGYKRGFQLSDSGSYIYEYTKQADEICARDSHSTNFRISAFRRPRDHVFSQYRECREEVWAVKTTRSWEACRHTNRCTPRNLSFAASAAAAAGRSSDAFPRAGSLVADYALWTSAIAANPLHDAFGCYSPWNMQSRAMTCCAKARCANHNSHLVTSEAEPNATEAIAAMRRLDGIAIAEHLALSLCLILHRLGRSLPASCFCTATSERQAPLRVKRLNAKPTKTGTPDRPSAATLGQRHNVEKLTTTDMQLYDAAVGRFNEDVDAMERELGRKLRCGAVAAKSAAVAPNRAAPSKLS